MIEPKNDKMTGQKEKQQEVYYGVGSFLWEMIKVIIWALVIIIPIRVFLFQPFFVKGASMEPNFEDGNYLIINELGYKQTPIGIGNSPLFTVQPFRELSRGDVVVFRYPRDPSQFFIKRVIGLPGEQVKIENNKITILNKSNPSGMILDESSYLSNSVVTHASNEPFSINLGDGEYFVLGDNRSASHDSRAWGAVPQADIVGKVLIRAWPVNKAGIL